MQVRILPPRPSKLPKHAPSISKKRGDVGLGAAIAWFVANGFTVSIPLTDSQDYDLVVDNGTQLQRVQVKTTEYKKQGVFQADLRVKGGNRSSYGKAKLFDSSRVELVFVLTSEGDRYVVPATRILAKTHLYLGSGFDEFKVL